MRYAIHVFNVKLQNSVITNKRCSFASLHIILIISSLFFDIKTSSKYQILYFFLKSSLIWYVSTVMSPQVNDEYDNEKVRINSAKLFHNVWYKPHLSKDPNLSFDPIGDVGVPVRSKEICHGTWGGSTMRKITTYNIKYFLWQRNSYVVLVFLSHQRWSFAVEGEGWWAHSGDSVCESEEGREQHHPFGTIK